MDNIERWKSAAENIAWYKAPDIVLDDSNPPFSRWFPDGVTNACYNAVDIHVEQGRGEQLAVIFDSPVTDVKSQLTYADLQELVAKAAGAFARRVSLRRSRHYLYAYGP